MSKCDTCIYRATREDRCKCNYIFITGHSRKCDVDDKCIEYKKGDRLRITHNHPMGFGQLYENKLNEF